MRSTLALIQIIILALYTQATNAAGSERIMRVLQPSINVPTTQFFDGSKQITLDAFRGHFVIVNFWATWCSPCIMEMPSLDRAAEKLAKNNVLVIAISQDEGGPTQVKIFLDRLKLEKIQILYDLDSKSFRDFAIRGLPTSVLLSPNGKILARLEGNAEWDQGPLLEQIRKLTAAYSKE
ncbi:MAG: TlpA disulfide reductase family protein [Nitrosomonadaceae bacterium]|nr:TlpA disulfide reductase family protein [Nitrosomonadaceae bacterium]